MFGSPKVKISITIAADLLSEIDSYVNNHEHATRSSVIESFLRRTSRRAWSDKLEEETISYYDQLSASEKEEDADWSYATSQQLPSLAID